MKYAKCFYWVRFLFIICALIKIPIQAQQIDFRTENQIRMDEKKALVRVISNIKSRRYSGTPEEIGKAFLAENSHLFRLNSNLSDMKVTKIIQSPAGYHVSFCQMYDGIPVMNSGTVVSINHENRISMVSNGYKPDIKVSTTPLIENSWASELARQAIQISNREKLFPTHNKLVIYEDSNGKYHLGWKVQASFVENGTWMVVIDAHTGDVMKRSNMDLNYVNGTGKVFDPDPGTDYRDASFDYDEDESEIEDAYDTVTLNDLNNAVGGKYYIRGKYAWSQDIESPNTSIAEKSTSNFTYTHEFDNL